MKKLIYFVVFLLISGMTGFGQSSYYDYAPSDREYIFSNDFINNDFNWYVGHSDDNCRHYKITNGYYEIQSTCNTLAVATWNNDNKIKLNDYDDFEIETSLMFVSGEENNGNGISWGNVSEKSEFYFCFSANGYYEFIKSVNGSWVDIKPWTTTELIKSKAYNKLTARKVDRTYYFFINDTYVCSAPYEPLSGQGFTIKTNQNSIARFDYIKIAKLKKKKGIDMNSVSAILGKNKTTTFSDNNQNMESDELNRIPIFYNDFSNNDFNWYVGTQENCRDYTVTSGYYELTSRCSNHYTQAWFNTTDDFVIDTDRDFEIETSIMFVKGEDNNGNGISWGQTVGQDRFYFCFSGNGMFYIGKSLDGTWKELKTWTTSSAINPKSYNTLTINKIKNQYLFYINKTLVAECPFEPFLGNVISFQTNQNSTMRVDYIRISYLESKSSSSKIVVAKGEDDQFSASLPPILSIQDIQLSKNLLKAGESTVLSVTLKNIGAGDAEGVYINLNGSLTGLNFPSKSTFPLIKANGGMQTINIDIKGGIDLPTSEALLKIEVIEPNFRVKIQGKQVQFPTREFSKPELLLAKFTVSENLSSDPNNQIDINEQIDVIFALQNVGQGDAENVTVTITNDQQGVMLLGVVDAGGKLIRRNPTFTSISPGKYETVTFRYFVNSEFESNQLNFNISATEKMGRYALKQAKSVEINKQLKEEGFIRQVAVNEESVQGKVIIEDIPDFVSDVNQNIPVSTTIDNNTFALVIGNENYNKEIQVKYALNDARIFKQYLQKTFGVPANNIHYIENATYGEILDGMKWINDVIKAFNGQAKVIVYYAGHGMPDEQTKSAFILPVDGNSQNSATAVKLSDLYNKLTEYPSQSVIVFLDACFSGSAREDKGGMLAEGRGVKIKPRTDLLNGNLIVFSAATGDETAFPFSEKQHGMFTYFLLKKLKESQGNVNLNDLQKYITTQVTQQSIVVNKKSQTPQVNTSLQVNDTWQNIKLR